MADRNRDFEGQSYRNDRDRDRPSSNMRNQRRLSQDRYGDNDERFFFDDDSPIQGDTWGDDHDYSAHQSGRRQSWSDMQERRPQGRQGYQTHGFQGQDARGQQGSGGFRGQGSAARGSRDYQSQASPGPHAGRGPKGYQRSDDSIREEVCEALSEHQDVDASEVEVSVKDGEVTLSGSVDDRRTKRLAEECAEGCRGVKDVVNQLRIQSATNNDKTMNLAAKDSKADKSQEHQLHS